MDPVHDVRLSFADFKSGHRDEILARALLGQNTLDQSIARIEADARRLALKPHLASAASPSSGADRDIAVVELRRDRAMLERATAAVRDSLLEAAQAAAEASRRARALADVLDQSLTLLGSDDGGRASRPSPRSIPASAPAADLSDREREVLTHVAAGRSNKAIAQALYLSPNTVKTHVSSLLRKLNASSRAQLATFAVQQGLGA